MAGYNVPTSLPDDFLAGIMPANLMGGAFPSITGMSDQPFDLGKIDIGGIGAGLPGMGKTGGGLFGNSTGLEKAGFALQGLQTLGGLWSAFQAAKLAKKQFKFTKEVTEKNLNNQTTAYNTTLEDRIRSRAAVEGSAPSEAQAYIDKNRLQGI